MISNRSLFPVACAAFALAFFSLGCASSRSSSHSQASACPNCSITVAETLPLPVSSDEAIARLDHSWTVMEHSCSCCGDKGTRFLSGAGYVDACRVIGDSGLCCANPERPSAALGLAQVDP